jgi:hypothetical protein
VSLDAAAFSETVRVELPEGFAVDELPAPVSVEASFGTYATTVETKAGEVLFGRRQVVRRTILPPEEYAAVRAFYDKIRASEQAPVVLIRK